MDLAQILKLGDLSEYKFHAARNNSYEQPLDVFIANREEWDSWNEWREKKNDFNRRYIIAFIQFYHEYETWLFGGVYEVLERSDVKQAASYKIRKTDIGEELIGRLKINLKLNRGRSFILENIYDKIEVCEILREPYSGQKFVGYENIDIDFSELESIYLHQRNDWKTALQNVKGIYVITDKHNGKKYVGSAYGSHGIWSRWGIYMSTGHGGNKELYELLNKVGIDYARENFKLTLIECWPFKTDDNAILGRETFWKKALLTRGAFGYNSN